MAPNVLVDKDENILEIDITIYRGIIGSLLYLTASRNNIIFSVCMCARYQVPPRESHFKTVKRILMYLNGTSQHDVTKDNVRNMPLNTCSLVGFSENDFTGCKSDRKITSGTCHLFENCLVS